MLFWPEPKFTLTTPLEEPPVLIVYVPEATLLSVMPLLYAMAFRVVVALIAIALL
jgi:hypothetical protein